MSEKGSHYKGTCRTCINKHPSLLHVVQQSDDKPSCPALLPTADVSNSDANQTVSYFSNSIATKKCLMIMPVYLTHNSNPYKEVLVHSLLDTITDTRFVSEFCINKLGINGIKVNLTLST